MLIVLVVESLEYILEVATLLDCNSLQLTIVSNSYAKVVVNRAKIYYLKFAAEFLFKGVNGGPTTDNLNVVYID